MIYADWIFYESEYRGNQIAVEDFDRLARRASAWIDYYTMGKAKHAPCCYELRMACCAAAEVYGEAETLRGAMTENLKTGMEGKTVKSESVGQHSVTYDGGASAAASASGMLLDTSRRLAAAVREYLLPTGLLYRGGGACVYTAHDHAL